MYPIFGRLVLLLLLSGLAWCEVSTMVVPPPSCAVASMLIVLLDEVFDRS